MAAGQRSGSSRRQPLALLLLSLAALLPAGRCAVTWPSECASLPEVDITVVQGFQLAVQTRYTTSLSTLELALDTSRQGVSTGVRIGRDPAIGGLPYVLCIQSLANGGTTITLPSTAATFTTHIWIAGGILYAKNVELVGGTGVGGIKVDGSRFTLDAVTLTRCNGNVGGLSQGSILINGGDTFGVLTDLTIRQSSGGAIFVSLFHIEARATLSFSGLTTFEDNSARVGAGIYVLGFYFTALSCTFAGPAVFRRNTATATGVTGGGGAIHVSGWVGASLEFGSTVEFSDNRATAGAAGAVYIGPDAGTGGSASVTFADAVTFTGNSKGAATGRGAGALVLGSLGIPSGWGTGGDNGPVSVVFQGSAVFSDNSSPGGASAAGAVNVADTQRLLFGGATTRFERNTATGGASVLQAGALLATGGSNITWAGSVVFEQNTASASGSLAGAVLLHEAASASFSTVTFSNNRGVAVSGATSAGALLLGSSATVIASATATFADNEVASGGGGGAINVVATSAASAQFRDDVVLTNNVAGGTVAGSAGGIRIGGVATLTFAGEATLADNSGPQGGAFAIVGPGAAVLSFTGRARLQRNTATTSAGGGGAIHVSGTAAATLTFAADTQISGNSAPNGAAGGIFLGPGAGGSAAATFASVRFEDNTKSAAASDGAGALAVGASNAGPATVVFQGGTVFVNNTSPGGASSAGAVFVSSSPHQVVFGGGQTTFDGNRATGSSDLAGALLAVGGNITWTTGTTFTRNTASGGGSSAGALTMRGGASARFHNTAAFTNNSMLATTNGPSAGALLLSGASTMSFDGAATFADNRIGTGTGAGAGAGAGGGAMTLADTAFAHFRAGAEMVNNVAGNAAAEAAGALSMVGTAAALTISAAANPAATAVFRGNTAQTSGDYAAGAILLRGLGGSNALSITCPAIFDDNAAVASVSASAGAISMLGGTGTVNLAGSSACFTGNQGAGSGAGAIVLARLGAGTPSTLTFGATTIASFGTNTVGGADRDIVADDPLSCGTTSRTAGTYVVEGELCAPTCTGSTCLCPDGAFERATCSCSCGSKPVLTVPGGADWPASCAGASSGQTCRGGCRGGYVGSFTALCTRGNWGLTSGSCEAIPCVGPPTIDVANGKWNCSSATPDGGSCTAVCAQGFAGSPRVRCILGAWSPLVTGACTSLTCSGVPSVVPPRASWSASRCNGTALCVAQCDEGWGGAPASSCVDGQWGAITGQPCTPTAPVYCEPTLTARAPQGSVCAGSRTLSASYLVISNHTARTTITATLPEASCTTATLTGPQQGVVVAVNCTAAAASGFAPGRYTITATGTLVGSAPTCPSSPTRAEAVSVVVDAPPAVVLAVTDRTPACPGTSVVAALSYAVQGGTAGAAVVQLAFTASVPADTQAACSVVRRGDASAGRLVVTCTLGSSQVAGGAVSIRVEATAQQGSCAPGSSSATAIVPVACCQNGSANAYADGATCFGYRHDLYCRARMPAIQSGWYKQQDTAGPVQAVLRTRVGAGCVPAGSSGFGTIGTVTTTCVSPTELRFNMSTYRSNGVAQAWYLVKCMGPVNSTAAASPPRERPGRCDTWSLLPRPGPVSATEVAVTSDATRTYTSWVKRLSRNACTCEQVIVAVSLTGTFAGPGVAGCGGGS